MRLALAWAVVVVAGIRAKMTAAAAAVVARQAEEGMRVGLLHIRQEQQMTLRHKYRHHHHHHRQTGP